MNQEWISVKDKLPDTGFGPVFTQSLNILVWTNDCDVSTDATMGFYSEVDGWHLYQSLFVDEVVTHWMPLPAPPK